MARAVVFDWYNTLAAPHPDDLLTSLRELITAAGGKLDGRALGSWEADHPLEHWEHSVSEVTYRAWQARRLEELLDHALVAKADQFQVLGAIEKLYYKRRFVLFPEVFDVLVELKDCNIRVGLCSNWDWNLQDHLRTTAIYPLLDFVICSAVFGCRKPHAAIFTHVITQARYPIDQVLYVGDNVSTDVIGALQAGIRAVHIARNGTCDPNRHPGAPCLRDLGELTALLQ